MIILKSGRCWVFAGFMIAGTAFAQTALPPGAPAQAPPASEQPAAETGKAYRVELKNGKIMVATYVKKTKSRVIIKSRGMTLRMPHEKIVSITEIK